MELDFLDEQDTRQNTELKKFVVQSALLCLSCQFIKKLKKNQASKKKIKSLNFAESNAHRKTNVRGSFETYNFFFFSLIKDRENPKSSKYEYWYIYLCHNFKCHLGVTVNRQTWFNSASNNLDTSFTIVWSVIPGHQPGKGMRHARILSMMMLMLSCLFCFTLSPF